MGPQGSRAAVMTKDNQGDSGAWMHVIQDFLKADVYKRSQGRLVRQMTCMAVWVAVALAAWRLNRSLLVDWRMTPAAAYGIAGLALVAGLWFGFRLVNLPTFADFLIAVEAEMNKVSWPSRGELFRATLVVILVVFFLAALLFAYDAVLSWILKILDGAVAWVFG